MTTDAHHPVAGRNRDFLRPPSVSERLDSFRRAHAHTRLVTHLKYALPAISVCILGLYFISPQIQVSIGDLDASVAGIVIEKGNLRMVNPKLEGVNDKQGTYVVTAKYAEQTVSNPDIIRLTELSSELVDSKKGWSRLTSPKGSFETKTERLALAGDIHVAQSNGMTAALTSADVDMKTQLVTSSQPVRVNFPDGTLDSLTMRIELDTKQATFKGDVRVHLDRQQKQAPPKPGEQAAQGLAGAFRNDAPVDIASPRLTIYDEKKLAHFEGGVTTVQAGSRMTATEMKVYYSGDPASGETSSTSGAGGGNKLKWIDVTGDVRINAEDGRSASASKLTYDALKQQLVLDTGVVLSQGSNVLKGAKMVSDLATGITRFPPLERVRGHFEPAVDESTPASAEPTPAPAEGTTHLDLSSTKGKPIDIESDSLTIDDKQHVAVFHGKVKAIQGTMTMRSSKLDVRYSGKEGTGETTGEGSRITSIRAEGRVLINTADDQATTSDWAFFDAARQTGLPLVIHSRDADDDMAAILTEETGKGAFPFVLHCFSSGRALAETAREEHS